MEKKAAKLVHSDVERSDILSSVSVDLRENNRGHHKTYRNVQTDTHHGRLFHGMKKTVMAKLMRTEMHAYKKSLIKVSQRISLDFLVCDVP